MGDTSAHGPSLCLTVCVNETIRNLVFYLFKHDRGDGSARLGCASEEGLAGPGELMSCLVAGSWLCPFDVLIHPLPPFV